MFNDYPWPVRVIALGEEEDHVSTINSPLDIAKMTAIKKQRKNRRSFGEQAR